MSRRYKRNDPKSTGRMFVIVGIVMILLGVAGFFQVRREKQEFDRCTAAATGTVVNVDRQRRSKKKDNRTHYYYVYVVDYVYEVDGVEIPSTVTLPDHSGDPSGMSVDIRYDPNEPTKHYSEYDEQSHRSGVILTVIFAVFGVICITAGIKAGRNITGEYIYGDEGGKDGFTRLN